ncbi:MAG: carbohydrate ABC transporter permease [Candidatus Humimicrobiaceae bacterium]
MLKRKNSSMLKRKNMFFAYFMTSPAIIFLLLVVGYPVFYLFQLAMSDVSISAGSLSLSWVGLKNFNILFKDQYFLEALKHTLYIVATSIPVSIIIALVLALCLDKIFRGRGIMQTAILLPWMIAPALAAAMWRWLYNDQFGLIDYVLKFLRIIDKPILWLSDPNVAINSIVICDVWQYTPFCTIILFAGLQDIPGELYEAAGIDGANALQVFWYITLRLLKSQILFVLIIRTVFTLRIFDYVYTLTRGGPGGSTEVLATYLYKTAFSFMKFDYSAAIGIILLLITAVVGLGYVMLLRGGAER